MLKPPDAGKAPCGLFSLPGELRNRIYRDVLIKPKDANGDKYIHVDDTGYARPGLVSVCKDIRAETLQIFYFENVFAVTVQDFDSTAHLNWTTQWRRMELAKLKSPGLSLGRFPGKRSWPNLMLWLQRYHERKIPAGIMGRYTMDEMPEEVDWYESQFLLLGAMFTTVRVLHAQNWNLVKAALETFRPSLVALEVEWRDD